MNTYILTSRLGFQILILCILFTPNAIAQKVKTKYNEHYRNDTLVSRGKETYSYDKKGNLISHLWQGSKTDTLWINVRKNEFGNYKKGSAGLIINKLWDAKSNSWIPEIRITNTYTSFNKLFTSISERKNANGWVLVSRSQMEYDKKHNLVKFSIERMDYQSKNWKIQTISNYKNNSKGNVIEATMEQYDIKSGTVRNSEKTKIEYDSLDRKTCYERNATRSYINYDNNGFVIAQFGEVKDSITGKTITTPQTTYVNNEFGDVIEETMIEPNGVKLQIKNYYTYSFSKRDRKRLLSKKTNK